jgi:hypothetical protein
VIHQHTTTAATITIGGDTAVTEAGHVNTTTTMIVSSHPSRETIDRLAIAGPGREIDIVVGDTEVDHAKSDGADLGPGLDRTKKIDNTEIGREVESQLTKMGHDLRPKRQTSPKKK